MRFKRKKNFGFDKKRKKQCQTQSAQYVDEGLRKATVPKATFECQMNTSQKDNGKLWFQVRSVSRPAFVFVIGLKNIYSSEMGEKCSQWKVCKSVLNKIKSERVFFCRVKEIHVKSSIANFEFLSRSTKTTKSSKRVFCRVNNKEIHVTTIGGVSHRITVCPNKLKTSSLCGFSFVL